MRQANINVQFDIEDCAHMKELRNTLCASVLLQTWVIGMSFIRHCYSFEILIGIDTCNSIPFRELNLF